MTRVTTAGLCIGRTRERSKFLAFVDDAPSGAGADVCFVRGLGGIGKTTLSQTLADDFLGAGVSAVVSQIDCASLPAEPSISAILRALPTDPERERPLRDAALLLDRIGAAVRTAPGPIDADRAERDLWHRARSATAAGLTFFTSAAAEQQAFGQLATSAQPAILASAQAAAAAMNAAVQIITELHRDGKISEAEREAGLDPDDFVVSTLAQYLAPRGSDSRHLIAFDKAENLVGSAPRLIELFDRAASRAGVKLTLLFAGRVSTLLATDGSLLSASEFLRGLPRGGLDLDLPPFDADEVRELVAARHEVFHGTREVPPVWMAEAIVTLSGGLPLWAASIAETLMQQPQPWLDAGRVEEALRTDSVDSEGLVERIFRGATLPDGTSAYPLLIALAISPDDCPRDVVCTSAGASATALSALQDRYSFMRGPRLHDTARVALRQSITAGGTAQNSIVEIAERLRDWVEDTKPSGSPHDGGDDWTRYCERAVAVELWISADDGARLAVDYALTGLPWAAPWVGPLFRDAAWMIERRSISRRTREAVSLAARAAFPLLIAEALSNSERESKSVIGPVIDKTMGSAVMEASLGRCLDGLHRLKERGSLALSTDAIVSLDCLRASWLEHNGFTDEAFELCLDCAPRANTYGTDATVRRTLGRAMRSLLETHVQRASRMDGSERQATEEQVDRLLGALLQVSPGQAAAALRATVSDFGLSPSRRAVLEELLTVRRASAADQQLAAELAGFLLILGDFSRAEQVAREALSFDPEWLRGAYLQARSLMCLRRDDEANAIIRSAAHRAETAANRGELTQVGLESREGLHTLGLLLDLFSDRSPTTQPAGFYGQIVATLFADSDPAVQQALDPATDSGAILREVDYSAEACIAYSRVGDTPNATRSARIWSDVLSRDADDRALEQRLLEAADRQFELPTEVREVLGLDS